MSSSLPPTSEPIPASDQLREALNELLEARRFIASGEAKSFDEAAYMCNVEDAARAAVEDLFSAQLSEIERLRRGLFGVERELADEIKRTTTREAELASLRSSSLTPEEAEAVLGATGSDYPYRPGAFRSAFTKLRALRSSTLDKGNTK